MMNLSTLRAWYARFFILVFMGISYFLLIRSADGGIAGFDSSFWGRRKLIANYADLRLALGDRVFPNVLVGEDGWMVFTAERSMDDYQNTFELSDEQLHTITSQLAEFQSRLATRGITLLVVIAPNKTTIYPEIVPGEIDQRSEISRLDRLTAHLQQNLPGLVLDLRPVLSEGRAARDVYYKTDTHWNDYGMFLAYQAIMRELAQERPELAPYPLEMFDLTEESPEVLDLAANTGSVTLREPLLQIRPRFELPLQARQMDAGDRKVFTSWMVGDDSLPRLLMYHDSFGFRLFGLLGMHFSNAVSVPHYSGRSIWSTNWVEQQDPDVVIIEFAERYLHDLEVLLSQ